MDYQKLPFSPPHLDQYIDSCWVNNFFSAPELEALNEFYQKSQNKKAAEVSAEGYIKEDLRKSTVTFLEPNDPATAPFVNKLAQLAIQVNFERYRFDLMGFYEPIQVAEYGVGDFFDWHSDFGQGASSTRKLSLSVQLSDPDEYEGGDLEFMINTDAIKAPRTKGTVIIFPSFVLHRVTPITAGIRRSMVGWVTGVPFR